MRKGIFLVGILLVPSVIYLLFSLGEHNTGRLGYLGEVSEITADGDTIVEPFQFPNLIDQVNKEFDQESGQGLVKVVHAFNWPCEERCVDNITTLNNYLNKVEHKDEWMLMSVCDNDIEADDLRELAAKKIYSGDNWNFYRHDKAAAGTQISGLFDYNPRSDENAAYVALLDQESNIRAYFNIRTQQDSKLLQDAIKLLIQEPHISWKEEK